MSKIVAITNQKGGVGKTTTAVNLSAALAQLGKSVLLVDVDPQGNATSGVGVDKQKLNLSMYDALANGIAVSDILCDTSIHNLTLAPSNIHLAGAEISLVSVVAREQVLKSGLDPLRKKFEYILIDSPPSLGLLTLNALTASDSVLVPIQCEYYALEGLTQLMSTVRLVKQRLNPTLEIDGVVLTMFDNRTNLSVQVSQEVRRFFKDKVYESVIPRNVRLSEAPSHGLPVTVYDPRCAGSVAYVNLAKEFIKWNEDMK